jgi:hypothetical protein
MGRVPRNTFVTLFVFSLIFFAFEFTSHRFYSAQVDRHFVTDVTEHRYFFGDKCDQSTSTNSDYLVQWERFGKAYWHPVKAVQFGFECLARYEKSGEEIYLKKAKANLDELASQASNPDPDSLLIEYRFDFALHGDKANTIHSPWRSAMAQGEAVSLSMWMFQFTQDTKYLELARKFLKPLLDICSENSFSNPCVTFIDSNQDLWLEEYAGDVAPMKVINGHIFALWGLYDYWAAKGDTQSLEILNRGIDTLENQFQSFRCPGCISFYGTRVKDNPRAQDLTYHRVVTQQLIILSQMSGDTELLQMSSILRDDQE